MFKKYMNYTTNQFNYPYTATKNIQAMVVRLIKILWSEYCCKIALCSCFLIIMSCKKGDEDPFAYTAKQSLNIAATATDTTTPTLKGSSTFPVGTAVDDSAMQKYSKYTTVLSTEFNSVTPESAMKFDRVCWQRNSFNFSAADYIVDFAAKHGQRVHGHTLVWQHALPDWLINFSGDSTAWEDIFKTYIKTMVSHFKGKVASWDVVNEAIDDNTGALVNGDIYGPGTGSLWRQHLGPNYIVRAFQYAHEADPNALLFYNDYGNDNGGWNDTKLNALLALVKSIQLHGVTISGIGVQMHINLTTDNANITATLKKLAATGLKIHISELDISVNPNNVPALIYSNTLQTLQGNKYQFIVQTYKTVVPKTQQFGITTWEFSDACSESTLQNKRDWRLLFDINYNKKPCYFTFLAGLKN
jgi:endo-1,4-beta-xylanase